MAKSMKISLVSHISDTPVKFDFQSVPAPDRSAKISKFNFEAYAVLEASPAQSKPPKYVKIFCE